MNAESEFPFQDLIEPFVAEARLRLQVSLGRGVDPVACRHLELHLGKTLSGLAGEALLAEFDVFRKNYHLDPGTDGRGLYRQFCIRMIQERLEGLLVAYPELARLIDLAIDRWVNVSVEFFNRLERDRSWIETALHYETPLGKVVELQAGISDPHCGGREAFIVTFEDGLRILYKPRTVALEAAWNNLLCWISAYRAPSAPPAISVLDSGGYGWTEFVTRSACRNTADVAEYYRRAGSLLCLIHLLDGNDCHMENIVATRHGPVLVDAESLLRPRIRGSESENSRGFAQARATVVDSVFGTGLLPQSQSGVDGETYDVSGFAGRGGYRIPHLRPLWKGINRDDMRMERSFLEAANQQNLPMLEGAVQSPHEWVDEIVEGFCGMWQWLHQHSERMIREALAPMACIPSRLLLRPSTTYGALLSKSLAVNCLRDRAHRERVLDRLEEAVAHRSPPPPWIGLVEKERLAVENMDIPYFLTGPNHSGEVEKGSLVGDAPWIESGHPRAVTRLRNLTNTQMEKQVEWIRTAFAAPSNRDAVVAEAMRDETLPHSPALSVSEALAEASRLGELIRERAIVGSDGVVTWIAPDHLQAHRTANRGGAHYLYSGASGVALFLAGLDRVNGDNRHREWIEGVLLPIKAMLQDPRREDRLRRENLGICSGIGSVIYTLVNLAGLTGREEYLETASHVAQLLTPARILSDRLFDVADGCAGALLALLALHSATQCKKSLRRAVVCGEHLLREREPGSRGGKAWKAWPHGELLAGFAHGASGVSLALARLGAATGREEFLEAAHDGIAYERTIFDESRRNWPIVPPPNLTSATPMWALAWCHGAPGIALARLELLNLLPRDKDALRREITAALESTAREGVSAIDHVCCGNMGRIETGLVAADRLSEGKWRKLALLGAGAIVHRARRTGNYALQPRPAVNAVFHPGFFRGISGIGYQLLRIAAFEKLPSVLSFEVAR